MANLKKFYSKSQLNFQMETVGTMDEIENRTQEVSRPGVVRFADSELNRPQVFRDGMTVEEIVYVSTMSQNLWSQAADSISDVVDV